MSELRYTLLPDGPSDKRLMPILTWLLTQHCSRRAIQEDIVDVRRALASRENLSERIMESINNYPCDILFVHRDAENETLANRKAEIMRAIGANVQPVVCVIPVRMQEAWLLFNEGAIRRAAGNPNGRTALSLPQMRRLEGLPDPKERLFNILKVASEKRGRRLKKFDVNHSAFLVAKYIDDFTPLRSLHAFRELEADLRRIIEEQNWNATS